MKLLRRLFRPRCHRVQQVLQSYLDGELGPEDAAMVAAHLQQCDRCGIEVDLYEQVKASLAELRTVPDPDALRRLQNYVEDLPGTIDPADDG